MTNPYLKYFPLRVILMYRLVVNSILIMVIRIRALAGWQFLNRAIQGQHLEFRPEYFFQAKLHPYVNA